MVFKGAYVNGKRHGVGREYDEFGKCTFIGFYFDGKKGSQGSTFNEKGVIISIHYFLNGTIFTFLY